MTRTRIVRWLRILLPLAALCLLSTLFLFSRESQTESQIPYAEVDAEAMARDPRVIAPQYAGVTDDGAELALAAADVAPRDGGDASDLRLDWRRPDGLTADVTAPAASMADGVIRLHGGVRMTTSTGWTIDAPGIDAAMDRSRLAAGEGISAQAPFGTLTAAQMELVPDAPGGGDAPEGDAPGILNFSGGVRLIYQP